MFNKAIKINFLFIFLTAPLLWRGGGGKVSAQGTWQKAGLDFKYTARDICVDTTNNITYLIGYFGMSNGGDSMFVYKHQNNKWDTLGFFDADARCGILFNNELYIGGNFQNINGVIARGVAKWNGTSFEPIGYGFNGTVSHFEIINNELYAMGYFTLADNLPVNYIAKWNGTNWVHVYNLPKIGTSMSVLCAIMYKNELYVGGNFQNDTIRGIIRYSNGNWHKVAEGLHGSWAESASKLVVYKNELYVAGAFNKQGGSAGTGIQKWDGIKWHDVGGGVDLVGFDTEDVYDMKIHNNDLWVCGRFDAVAGLPTPTIAKWTGEEWCNYPGTFTNFVRTFDFIDDTLYIVGTYSVTENNVTDSLYYFAKYTGNLAGDTCAVISTSVKEQTPNGNLFSVFPNPNNGIFTLKSESHQATVSITNILGETVCETKVAGNEMQIDISGYAKGLYNVRLLSPQGTELKRVLIE